MKTKLALAISSILALSACDDYKLSSEAEGTHSVGTVAISGDPYTGITLSADITDADGFDKEAVYYSWMRDGVVFNRVGSTYVLTDADLDTAISVLVIYTDYAGYDEQAISSATDLIEIPPVQSEGSVAISGKAWVGIVLEAIITDENGTGDNEITYTWMADGVVIEGATTSKYMLTTAELGKIISVSVTYVDNDGFDEIDILSAETTAVTEPEEEILTTQVAAIIDVTDGDTGELRLKLSDIDIDPILKGKLTVSFRKDGDPTNNNPDEADTDAVTKDAYIGLFGSSTSSGFDLAELRIKRGLQDGGYELRNQADITISSTFTEDDWVEVEITWDASVASDTAGPLMTVSIDGQAVTDDGFNTLAVDGKTTFSTLTSGVQFVLFRIGDTQATIDATFYIDNIKIYDDSATDPTVPVFEDDFEPLDSEDAGDKSYVEGYDEGYLLNPDINGDSPYNNNSSDDVVVEIIQLESDGEGTGENLYAASLIDTSTSIDADLVYTPAASIPKGRLTMSFFKQALSTGSDGQEKDAYIGLYTSGNSNAEALIDLRLHGVFPEDGGLNADGTPASYGTFEQRNGAGLELDPAVILTATDNAIVTSGDSYNQGVHYEVGVWQDIEILWDASSDTLAAEITVKFEDKTYEFDSTSIMGVAADAFEKLSIRFSDGSRTVKGDFQVDDIMLYSIDVETGEETLIIDEDFEDDAGLDEAPERATTTDQTTIQYRN